MMRRPSRATRTDTLFPYTPRVRSPGDLGKPILEHQQSTMVAIDPADQERQQAEAAERDRQLAELKAARESGVLVQGRQGSGGGDAVSVTAAPSAPTDQATAPKLALDATNDPNAQGRKADFVANLDPRGDVNPHALTPPPSPSIGRAHV